MNRTDQRASLRVDTRETQQTYWKVNVSRTAHVLDGTAGPADFSHQILGWIKDAECRGEAEPPEIHVHTKFHSSTMTMSS